MSLLGERQELFMELMPRLLAWGYARGYRMRGGELWRPPEMVAIYAARGSGSANSLHPLRLAIDINLFLNGTFLETSESHRPLGDFWKSLHPLCRWGGDFRRADGTPKPDGNHYSIEHNGVR